MLMKLTPGRCQNKSLATNSTQSSKECLELCQTETACKWFTFDSSDSSCNMYGECNDLIGCNTCTSGNFKCSLDSKGMKKLKRNLIDILR